MTFDVKLEISRAAVARGYTVERALADAAPALARGLSRDVRERVQQRGDLAGQGFPGWRQWTPRRYAVSPRYPDGVQGEVGPSGAEWFKSRAEYHRMRGTEPGTYSVSGGMWAGLSVVIDGPYRVSIRFRGRSEGADPNFTRKKTRTRRVGAPAKPSGGTPSGGLPAGGEVPKKPRQPRIISTGPIRVRPLKVNNSLKAWTILRAHRVNVLALAEAELERLALDMTNRLAHGVGGVLPVVWDTPLRPTVDAREVA